MGNSRTGDISVNVPTSTPAEVKREVQELVIAVNTDPVANMSFQQAVTNAGLNTTTTPATPPQDKQPPYLLIGGVLLISYFLFFK
jgi:hypothetical protein